MAASCNDDWDDHAAEFGAAQEVDDCDSDSGSVDYDGSAFLFYLRAIGDGADALDYIGIFGVEAEAFEGADVEPPLAVASGFNEFAGCRLFPDAFDYGDG